MKPLKIVLLMLAYLTTYFTVSFSLDRYFSLQTNFLAMALIGLFFGLVLISLIIFEIPDKIVAKLTKKEEITETVEENHVGQNESPQENEEDLY